VRNLNKKEEEEEEEEEEEKEEEEDEVTHVCDSARQIALVNIGSFIVRQLHSV
jgi:hypothetical protein